MCRVLEHLHRIRLGQFVDEVVHPGRTRVVAGVDQRRGLGSRYFHVLFEHAQRLLQPLPARTRDFAIGRSNVLIVDSNFGGSNDSSLRIGFYGLPAQATIRIFSFSGQLVQTIEHDNPTYSVAFLQETRNDQRMASGVYFYVVTTPEGEQTTGKFVIIR